MGSAAHSAIVLDSVTKNFGRHIAVDNVSLTVKKGEVFGFLGPNGAGKSTTIRMMLGQLRPHDGSIRIFGHDAIEKRREVHRLVGYLGGDMALDTQLTGMQFLRYIGRLHGGVPRQKITQLAHRLDCDLKPRIGALSRGNRQKVGLISALMHDPQLLILDEPTSGFDPLIQAEFNAIIREHRERGRTVFISSHILSEVRHLCDRIAFIREGKLIREGNMAELAETTLKTVRVIFTDKSEPHVSSLREIAGVTDARLDGSYVIFRFDGQIKRLLGRLAEMPVADVQIEDVDLEELFMQYYRRSA